MIAAEALTYSFTAKDGSEVVLRPARPEDADAIVREVEAIVAEGRFIKKEEVRTVEQEQAFIREQISLGNMYMVAEVDGQVRGLARVLRGDLQMIGHIGEFRIWLGPGAQGKGIGRKMMEYTIEWGRAQPDLRKIMLGVYANNQNAYKLYQSIGFIEEGRLKDQVRLNGKYDDEIVMSYFYR